MLSRRETKKISLQPKVRHLESPRNSQFSLVMILVYLRKLVYHTTIRLTLLVIKQRFLEGLQNQMNPKSPKMMMKIQTKSRNELENGSRIKTQNMLLMKRELETPHMIWMDSHYTNYLERV